MITVLVRFPARRYHATPWGHHVNEGMIEWPPSPWRILRALLSVGYTTGLWDANGPPPIAKTLIEKLSSELPIYRLPSASGAHSRHYMPTGKLDSQEQPNRTLVFDTWAHIDDGALVVSWNVELNPHEKNMLSDLAEGLGYLGRSESWTDARLMKPDEPYPEGDECVPSDDPPRLGWEQVSLMAIQPVGEYAEWRQASIEKALSELSARLPNGKKPTKKQKEKATAPYPPDLIDCLQVQSSWLHKHGWSQPPGSRRVFYLRPVDSLESGAPRPRYTPPRPPRVQAMLLSLSTATGNDHALPTTVRTLPQAELFHKAMTSHATRDGGTCTELTGCDMTGRPLKGPHNHAHVLPLDLDGDGHLDHILVWAPGGLSGKAQQAIRSVRQTPVKGGIEPLCLASAGAGSWDDLIRLPDKYGRRLRAIIGPGQGATVWTSLTPFVCPRYLKKSGRNNLQGQLAAELSSRRLPSPAEVTIFEPGIYPQYLRHRHFIRARRRGPRPPADFGYTLKIRFREPLRGPLCLGYASHFGLGLFVSENTR